MRLGCRQIASYVRQLKLLFSQGGTAVKSVGGFATIANVFPGMWNWMDFWSLTAMISIMLAVVNILPIPALDGGHVLFLLYEVVTRRKPGDKFMGMDLSHGGHLSHGSPVNFSGLMFNPISYTVEAETGRVNYEEMEEKPAPSVQNSSSPAPAHTAANGTMPASARLPMKSAPSSWSIWPTLQVSSQPDCLKTR